MNQTNPILANNIVDKLYSTLKAVIPGKSYSYIYFRCGYQNLPERNSEDPVNVVNVVLKKV